MTERLREAARRMAEPALRNGFNPVALHRYTNRRGKPILWRIRCKHPVTGEKWIRPMHITGGAFVMGEPRFDGGKPLYGLPRINTNPDADVWIVEGETKVEELSKLGLVATTSGSATSADGADWEPLRGRVCRLWPDNDDPGKSYAGEVTTVLVAMGCNVSCIEVDKLGLSIGEDVVDWLTSHPEATGDDIAALPVLAAQRCSLIAGIATIAVAEWADPQPLSVKVPTEPYPIDALPETIRAAVDEVQAFTKAPLPMVAGAALGALALAIQSHADIKRADKLHGPVGLFLLTIADSGERKSTCDGFFTSAIRDYQTEQAELAKPEQEKHRAKLAAWEAKRTGMLDAIKQASKQSKATASVERDLHQHEQDKPEPPRVPKLLRGDDTPENLAYVLAREWPSAGVISAEGGIIFGSHGMGNESAMRNMALLNIAWDGGTLDVGRRSKESFTVRGARLTVAIQVQEATLRSFFDKSGALARGTGFLARFLVAWPESTQGFRPFSEAPANWPHLAEFNRRIAAILNQSAPIDDNGGLSPPMLTLAPEAKRAWVAYHDAIESELASGGELYDVRDVASKSADNAARLAALFQIFEHATGSAVGLDSFEGASRIAAWHLNESRRFFGELALPSELADAAQLDAWLIAYCRRNQVLSVAKNFVRQHGKLRDGARLDAAIRELTDLERLRLNSVGKQLIIHLNPGLVD